MQYEQLTFSDYVKEQVKPLFDKENSELILQTIAVQVY